MVLPSDVVEQEEVEEKTERTKEEEVEEEEEGKVKEGEDEGPTAEELGQAVVVVPTPPDTGTVRLPPTPTEETTPLCEHKYISLYTRAQ